MILSGYFSFGTICETELNLVNTRFDPNWQWLLHYCVMISKLANHYYCCDFYPKYSLVLVLCQTILNLINKALVNLLTGWMNQLSCQPSWHWYVEKERSLTLTLKFKPQARLNPWNCEFLLLWAKMLFINSCWDCF